MRNRTERDQQYHLLNEEELQRFLSDHAGMDGLELQHGLFQTATEQLRQMVNQRRYAAVPTGPRSLSSTESSHRPQTANPRPQTPTPLARFAGLHPTEEQIHQALLCLMEMPHPDGKGRKLIHYKSHWLAVMRALQFLGVKCTKHGGKEEFVRLVNGLMAEDASKLTDKSFRSVEYDRPFIYPLSSWYSHLMTRKEKDYWRIAITFLDYLVRKSS